MLGHDLGNPTIIEYEHMEEGLGPPKQHEKQLFHG